MKNKDASASLLLVGVIAKPHGIRGELCIDSYADSPLLFEEAPCLFVRAGENAPEKKMHVEAWRRHKGRVLLTLKGVHDRNISETLRGHQILVDKNALPEMEEEVYLHELIGLEILNEDGSMLGTLQDFLETPQQEIWVIITPDGKEVMLPVVEEFIVDVDVENARVTVAPPEGLLDIYLEEPKKKKKKRRRPPRRRKKKAESGS